MERKLASVQVIKDLTPIEGADKIERATVLGWHLVVKKGEFQVGDKCVYCEVDSVLPEKPEFEFLRPRGFRIKTVKLRGQVSQGIAFPLTILPKPPQTALLGGAPFDPERDLHEGDDVTTLLGIKKYIPQIPAQLSGKVKGTFPSFIPKTDETRIQSVPDVLKRHEGKMFIVTEKVDGSSMTVFLKGGEFGVCSRNLELYEDEKNSYWKMARQLDLENKLRSLNRNLSIQGELLGQGIQKNKYKLTGLDFYVFNVFDIDQYRYLDFEEAQNIIKSLYLKSVPIVGEAKMTDVTVDDLVKLAEGDMKLNAGGDGKSLLNRETVREGLVFRPYKEEQDPELGRLSFKVINPKFLLKYDE